MKKTAPKSEATAKNAEALPPVNARGRRKKPARKSEARGKNAETLPAVNARERKKRIGSIGSGVRSSQATNAPPSASPQAKAPTTSTLPQPAALPRTSPQTTPSAAPLTSARPPTSIAPAGPKLSGIRRTRSGASEGPSARLTQQINST